MIRSLPLEPYIIFADDASRPGLDILQNGFNYERHIVAELRKFIPTSIGFYDIGANVGVHTLIAKSIRADVPIVCAECSQFNIDLLCRNITYNKLSNVTVLPFPLADQPRIVRTNLCDANMCCSLDGLPDSEAGYPRLSPALSLDVLSLPPADLVKIDVEGFEIMIFRGATRLLASRPRILMEMCLEITHRSGLSPVDTLQFFVDRGYTLTTLDYLPGMRATFTSAADCLGHIKQTSKWICDLLLEPT